MIWQRCGCLILVLVMSADGHAQQTRSGSRCEVSTQKCCIVTPVAGQQQRPCADDRGDLRDGDMSLVQKRVLVEYSRPDEDTSLDGKQHLFKPAHREVRVQNASNTTKPQVRKVNKSDLHLAPGGGQVGTRNASVNGDTSWRSQGGKVTTIHKFRHNGVGGLETLLCSLQLDVGVAFLCIAFFMLMSRQYPYVFSFRATGADGQGETMDAPISWSADQAEWFQWVKASYSTSVEMMIDSSGLDAAFLIRFSVMAMEIMIGIGIPNMFILGTMYCFAGGRAAGDDRLSHLGILNVDTEKHSWIYWFVAAMVWYNVVFIQWRLYKWQKYFLVFRTNWLLSTPPPQDNTILVQGIPNEHCSDEALKKYFAILHGEEEVLEAVVVKKTQTLRSMVQEYKDTEQQKHEVLSWMHKHPDRPPPTVFMTGESMVDWYNQKLEQLKEDVIKDQNAVKEEAAKSPDESTIYSSNGFVTFKTRRTAEIALAMQCQADHRTFVVSRPPEPSDIQWTDLERPEAGADFLQVIGWTLVIGLFLAFLPIVLGISDLAMHLQEIPLMKRALAEGGILEPHKATINGQLASVGLSFMMCMLPTFLKRIIDGFWFLKAELWAQLELQMFYYWFQVAFVLLFMPVGDSLLTFLHEVIESPKQLILDMGHQMPLTTHFYMNYVVMQWAINSLNMTRYSNLIKFLIYRRFCDDERARSLSEPEDQDYYGIGSRSARWNIMFAIGVVFGTISPLLCFLVCINFFICRGIYGYLMNFAEQCKPDLGGVFWVRQLLHCHYSVFIYILLMTGVLLQLEGCQGPPFISTASLVWYAWALHRHYNLYWEKLPFENVVKGIASGQIVRKRTYTETNYVQPELREGVLEAINDPLWRFRRAVHRVLSTRKLEAAYRRGPT